MDDAAIALVGGSPLRDLKRREHYFVESTIHPLLGSYLAKLSSGIFIFRQRKSFKMGMYIPYMLSHSPETPRVL